jgi:hypothetical protein
VVHNILRHIEVEISEKEESNQVCTRPWFLPADDGFYGLSLDRRICGVDRFPTCTKYQNIYDGNVITISGIGREPNSNLCAPSIPKGVIEFPGDCGEIPTGENPHDSVPSRGVKGDTSIPNSSFDSLQACRLTMTARVE